MTKIITRYFERADQAMAARDALVFEQKVAPQIVRTFTDAEGLADKLTALQVTPSAAQAYQERLAKGGAVMLVEAGCRPLGVARMTREAAVANGAVALDGVVDEVEVKDPTYGRRGLSVLQSHPRFMSGVERSSRARGNHHMADWPIPLLSKRKPYDGTLFYRHAHMANWPFGLLSQRKPYTKSIFGRHQRMASFPIKLISQRKPFTGSIIPLHGRMANIILPLTNRRKPFNRSIFPRHQRMATVPFPLLINSKTGSNALMPGAPRMANFPIGLLSTRKPFTGSIFSRHARMANFPIGLLSRRKPFTGSIFPKHARMANFILPLVIERQDPADRPQRDGFSFSRMLGMPTLIQR